MAKTFDQHFDELRDTRVWRSIFRSGTGSSTLKRALAIQQNVFLHLFSTKVRTRMLSIGATWYLGTLTLGTFLILVGTGIPLMLYYHPSAPQAYADTKDLQFVFHRECFCAVCIAGRRTPWSSSCSRTCSRFFIAAPTVLHASSTG